MSERITKNLVSESLFRAVSKKKPPAGLIHHSDRGSQYCSEEYRRLIDHYMMKASMSRKGNCYDNAPMESFFGTLKQELVSDLPQKSKRRSIKKQKKQRGR
jgi:transposase InsO family protein